MIKLIIITCLALFIGGCSDSNGAKRVLETNGYSKITIIGIAPLSCSKDDFYRTKFRAVKNGNVVTGAVCSGLLFKGATIRLN